MTEDEMKQTWCPDARVDSTGSNRPNAGPNVDVSAGWPPCIGRGCSQWRWRDMSDPNLARPDLAQHHGYCGRAGRP